MAAFEYTALSAEGKQTRGVVTADSPRAARKELRMRQLTPLDVKVTRGESEGKNRFGGGISAKSRALLTRQLAVMLQSGMTVEEALRAAAGEGGDARVRKLMLGARSRVMEGARFADALSEAPKAFPQLYRAVVAAGEASGQLGLVLESLAEYLESTYRLRRQVQSALIYPAVLAVMALLMVGALMIFIVPRLVEQFDLMGGNELPFLTRMVMGASGFIRDWGWLVAIAIAIGALVLGRLLSNQAMRLNLDRTVLALPFIGSMQRTVLSARFARIYATLSASGAPVLDALQGAKAAMTNQVFARAAQSVSESVREGGSFAGAMRRTGAFPPIMIHMAASGEQGRDLPGMMNRAADFLESEFESSAQVALGLLEPLIIVVLGGLVGLIVLSIMLPIMQLNSIALG
ncbi:MAG: type II secretion system inner membrane protein GspF [Pseudomonadota bacterium]